jgi:hypothetical protein
MLLFYPLNHKALISKNQLPTQLHNVLKPQN